jgi:UDP-N-acetylmuramoyl-tripeptide--D-alanyl-D-alanine ligase
LKSAGNLNNEFGMPLQLLKLEPEHEVAVIEMGMNHAGEIRALAKIAEPNWAVVSNVAAAHLENFPEGIAGIAAAKYELVEALPSDGLAVLNFDDPYVASFARGLGERAVMYGTGEGAAVRAEIIRDQGGEGVRFTVTARGDRAEVALRLLGRHNVMNALAAIAVGVSSGMTLTECAAALGELRPGSKRGEVIVWRGATVINDSYNSNPRALDAMVEALLSIEAPRHVVVAGEMLELGPEATALHAACGRRMAELGIDVVRAAERRENPIRRQQLEGAEVNLFITASCFDELSSCFGEARRIEHDQIVGLFPPLEILEQVEDIRTACIDAEAVPRGVSLNLRHAFRVHVDGLHFTSSCACTHQGKAARIREAIQHTPIFRVSGYGRVVPDLVQVQACLLTVE